MNKMPFFIFILSLLIKIIDHLMYNLLYLIYSFFFFLRPYFSLKYNAAFEKSYKKRVANMKYKSNTLFYLFVFNIQRYSYFMLRQFFQNQNIFLVETHLDSKFCLLSNDFERQF